MVSPPIEQPRGWLIRGWHYIYISIYVENLELFQLFLSQDGSHSCCCCCPHCFLPGIYHKWTRVRRSTIRFVKLGASASAWTKQATQPSGRAMQETQYKSVWHSLTWMPVLSFAMCQLQLTIRLSFLKARWSPGDIEANWGINFRFLFPM